MEDSQEEMINHLLHHLQNSKQPDATHLRVLSEVEEVLTKGLFINYQKSWLTGD